MANNINNASHMIWRIECTMTYRHNLICKDHDPQIFIHENVQS